MTAPRQLHAVPDMTLAVALRERRAGLALTQLQAAERMGVRQQLVANWEAGSRPSAKHAEKLAEFLGFARLSDMYAALEGERRQDATNSPLGNLVNGVASRLQQGVPLTPAEVSLISQLVALYGANPSV